MQFLGPAPKGKKEELIIFSRLSSQNRSGSNFSGSGQYLGSLWIGKTGIQHTVPTSKLRGLSSEPSGSITIDLIDLRSIHVAVGHLRSVSEKKNYARLLFYKNNSL